MTEHRLEVADVFHAHQGEFFQRWGHAVSDQHGRLCVISVSAAPLRWART